MARKKKSNRILYILIALVVIGVIGAVAAKSMGLIGQPPQTEVELAKVGRTTIVEKVNASGMIQPEMEVKISPDVSGEITELHVKEGDSVTQGQLLIKIRPDNYQSVLARMQANYNQQLANLSGVKSRAVQTEAQLEQAKNSFKRSQQLYEQKVISDADFEQAKANFRVAQQEYEGAKKNVEAARYMVESARATVAEAKETLDLTSVHAPVTGIVSKLNVEQGERVVGTSQMSGTEMMRIANLSNMEVRVDVNENDIIRVNVGDTAIIDVDSYSHMDRSFQGVVTAVANTANTKASPDAVTEFEVKVRILNDSYQDLTENKAIKIPFRPGMTASVEVITNKKENVLAVPLAAVTTRSESEKSEEGEGENGEENADKKPAAPAKKEEIKEVVFITKEGKAYKSEVKTGISDYDNIEILSGLDQGQEIIAGPYLVVSKRLNEGDAIRPKEEKEGTEKAGM